VTDEPRKPAQAPPPPHIDPFARLRNSTPARIGLGRSGHGLPTAALLEFQLAHARARDAVHEHFNPEAVAAALVERTVELTGERAPIIVHSQAPDRQTYLQRPDLGRQLRDTDVERLLKIATRASDDLPVPDVADQRSPGAGPNAPYEVAFILGDGLCAPAVHTHAAPLLGALLPKLPDWHVAPIVIACQARVALGDEIGALLGANLVVMLIGERPGLSAPDSLGAYLTWQPRRGRQDSERNCISNIRPPTGLTYDQAASRIAWLLSAARRQKLTGVGLKDASTTPALPPPQA
jgi:ethanolamine ammonia-lyase small subunit